MNSGTGPLKGGTREARRLRLFQYLTASNAFSQLFNAFGSPCQLGFKAFMLRMVRQRKDIQADVIGHIELNRPAQAVAAAQQRTKEKVDAVARPGHLRDVTQHVFLAGLGWQSGNEFVEDARRVRTINGKSQTDGRSWHDEFSSLVRRELLDGVRPGV